MAEIDEIEHMFIKKHKHKTNRTEIQKINENRNLGTGSGYLCKLRCMQDYSPCGYDESQHDNVIPVECKVICIEKVGNKIGKKIRTNRNDDIKDGKN